MVSPWLLRHLSKSPCQDGSSNWFDPRRSGDYFTLDSTKDDVLAVQGTPTSIVGETWYYSYSTINFYNGRVRGYSNTSKNLHVKVLPKSESSLTSKGYFTIGSTHDEVLAVQGTPSSIIGETWYYSYSTISFYNGRVRATPILPTI